MTVGIGPLTIFHDGKFVEGTWRRNDIADPFVFLIKIKTKLKFHLVNNGYIYYLQLQKLRGVINSNLKKLVFLFIFIVSCSSGQDIESVDILSVETTLSDNSTTTSTIKSTTTTTLITDNTSTTTTTIPISIDTIEDAKMPLKILIYILEKLMELLVQ
ncbi:MAG: hypothetical protein CM15mP10_1770 [Actinomycetota bacterium]|nr:MAG: hypothetical protein CM15mP10_1770 [Actinomycetota bacterium]